MATLPRTEHRVARSLAETLDPQEALERALAAIGEGLGWRLGAAWEPAPGEPGVLVCVETWCAPDVDSAEFVSVSRDLRLAPGEGLPGRVWATGEAAWIADVQYDPNFPRAPAAGSAGLHAAFCFPLRSARGVLGVVEFYTGEPRELDSELLEMMATLGDQIGQAVERRRDARHLRAARTRHEAMLEVALDAVISIDEDGHVLEFNPAAERIFGYTAAEAVGRDMAELIVPPELRERHRAGFARYRETREPAVLDQRLELTGMRVDGSTFPVELTITRIELPDQAGFAGYLRDITERKQWEAEMRASRARIVEAGDEARKKLERDLHDGAQQRLVELGLQLRMARAKIDANPMGAAEFLDAAVEALTEATAELRELARGIHPVVLTEGGLQPALRALVERSSIPAKLTDAPDQRFPAAVEAAAYFVVAEALTNAARYSGASAVEVSAAQVDGRLRVTIRDDGRGEADLLGSGVRGIADRVAAVDGALSVRSPAGRGTVVRAEIPCE
ncbi:MAG TPA: PAS domain S-box protein [Thermoleophilaceae bacterium]